MTRHPVISRFLSMPPRGIDPRTRLRIEPGTIADYDALAHHHYRAGRPATWVKVLRVVDPAEKWQSGPPRRVNAVAGWQSEEPAAAMSGHFATVPPCHSATSSSSGRLVAVLVISMPTLNGAWRKIAWPEQVQASRGADRLACPSGAEEGLRVTDSRGSSPADAGSSGVPNRGPSRLGAPPLATIARPSGASTGGPGPASRREAAERLNASTRCIARLVVHPAYRALGVASMLVRAYLDDPLTERTEALAAMAPFCPVFEAAGMRRITIPPTAADARLHAALQRARVKPASLAEPRRARAILARRPEVRRALRAWAWKWKGARAHVEKGNYGGIARLAVARLVGERMAYVADVER